MTGSSPSQFRARRGLTVAMSGLSPVAASTDSLRRRKISARLGRQDSRTLLRELNNFGASNTVGFNGLVASPDGCGQLLVSLVEAYVKVWLDRRESQMKFQQDMQRYVQDQDTPKKSRQNLPKPVRDPVHLLLEDQISSVTALAMLRLLEIRKSYIPRSDMFAILVTQKLFSIPGRNQ